MDLFSKNIVYLFCNTFRCVDNNTRSALIHLLETWKRSDVFSATLLQKLEVELISIVSQQKNVGGGSKSLHGGIHVNPNFIPPFGSKRQWNSTDDKVSFVLVFVSFLLFYPLRLMLFGCDYDCDCVCDCECIFIFLLFIFILFLIFDVDVVGHALIFPVHYCEFELHCKSLWCILT